MIKLVICYTRVRTEHQGLFEVGILTHQPLSPASDLHIAVTPTQIHTLLAASKEDMEAWLATISYVLQL